MTISGQLIGPHRQSSIHHPPSQNAPFPSSLMMHHANTMQGLRESN